MKSNAIPRKSSRIRKAQEAYILEAAEEVFAQYGYHGASIDMIAEVAKLSKQNVLYYFSTKEILYRQILENLLDVWIGELKLLERSGKDPASKLESYIRCKIELSRSRPHGSRVFANEIINGAPFLREHLQNHLVPQVQRDVKLVRRWIKLKKLDAMDPWHLFFMIWAATQTYADFATQIQIVLGKDSLDDQDFDNAAEFLVQIILKGTGAQSGHRNA